MIEEKENKIEVLLKRVGGEHKYQYTVFIIFAVKWIIAAMILFSLNFFYFVPDFQCSSEEMVGQESCEEYVCSVQDQGFWKDHMGQLRKSSIALDYGVIMVCSKEWVASFLQSLQYLGALFGYIVMSHVGDNLGRKKGQYISWLICVIGELFLLFSANLEMIGIGSILLGFGANAAITLHYSFFKELVLGSTRERMIIAIQVAFSIGISLISLLSYFIDTWKYTLGFCILIPSVVITFAMGFVEETPDFILKNKGIKELKDSLNRIARYNHNQELEQDEIESVLKNHNDSQEKTNVTFIDLFRYPSLQFISISCALINMTVEFIYDGTILSLGKFGINVYFDQILVGLVEVSAAIFGSFIVPKVKRKRYITISFCLMALICLAMGIESLTYNHTSDEVNFHTILEMVLIAFLRFLIASVWGILFVYVSELFPSEVSSLSFGWVSVMGTIGASISPYIRLATANLTMFVMTIFSISIAIAIRPLTETKGKAIRNRIKEREEAEKKRDTIVSQDV